MSLFDNKNRPLTIVIVFNLLTLFIFYTAPYQWETGNRLFFFIFALLCQLMVYIGYRKGYSKYSKARISNVFLDKISKRKISYIFIFYCLTFLIKYAFLLRFSVFDIKGMITFLGIGIVDPQFGYLMSLDTTRPYTISWSIFFFISIIDQIFFIIGFISWKNFSKLQKILFICFLALEVIYWLGRGTTFGLISLITTFLFIVIDKINLQKVKLKQTIGITFITILLFWGGISVFSYNLSQRSPGSMNANVNLQQYKMGFSRVDEANPIFSILPNSFDQTYMLVVSYMAQGYYNTCLAFDLDFQSTYLLGNNPALINLTKVIGIDVWDDTYMVKLDHKKDVDQFKYWHSAYTWWANDFSYFLVPFVYLFLGYLLGVSWIISRKGQDFLSKIVFVVIGNMLLLTFANNTYLSSVFYSFMFIFPIWFFTRVKRFALK